MWHWAGGEGVGSTTPSRRSLYLLTTRSRSTAAATPAIAAKIFQVRKYLFNDSNMVSDCLREDSKFSRDASKLVNSLEASCKLLCANSKSLLSCKSSLSDIIAISSS